MSSTRNTPLTARSVLASVLLGTDPPWLPTPLLVRTTALFGISEGSTRTALSRLVTAGDAEATDGGYRLVGRLVARQQRQSASRLADTRPWDGSWELATVDGDTRRPAADRADLRDALGALRLVELREGTWGRPDNLDPDRSADAAPVVARWCVRWTGARPDPEPDVASAFGLGGVVDDRSHPPGRDRRAAPAARARRRHRPARRVHPLGRGAAPSPGRPAAARTRSSRRAGRAPRSARSTTATTSPTGPRCGPGSAPRGDQRAARRHVLGRSVTRGARRIARERCGG